MESWIGPAIVAAVISALVSAAGWFVTYQRELRLEAVRRREKVIDVQTALRAEMRSYRHGADEKRLAVESGETLSRFSSSATARRASCRLSRERRRL